MALKAQSLVYVECRSSLVLLGRYWRFTLISILWEQPWYMSSTESRDMLRGIVRIQDRPDGSCTEAPDNFSEVFWAFTGPTGAEVEFRDVFLTSELFRRASVVLCTGNCSKIRTCSLRCRAARLTVLSSCYELHWCPLIFLGISGLRFYNEIVMFSGSF